MSIFGSCKLCLHFMSSSTDTLDKKELQGFCRRFPPQGHVVPGPRGIELVAKFPPVKGTMQCGEFASRVEVKS